MFTIATACGTDVAAIDHLLDTCFGPARRARTAYRLRDGAAPLDGFSLVARDGEAVIGSVQLWPLALLHGRSTPLLLLGPLAVAPDRRCEGLGTALMTEALARVDAAGAPPVVLIGDAPYYARFGFAAAPLGWQVPGPVDRTRLLVRGGEGLPGRAALAAATPPRRIAA